MTNPIRPQTRRKASSCAAMGLPQDFSLILRSAQHGHVQLRISDVLSRKVSRAVMSGSTLSRSTVGWVQPAPSERTSSDRNFVHIKHQCTNCLAHLLEFPRLLRGPHHSRGVTATHAGHVFGRQAGTQSVSLLPEMDVQHVLRMLRPAPRWRTI